MSMTVPNVAEWQREPSFEECECYCVRVAKRAWPDCTGCGGAGVIGTVSIGVFYAAHERGPMPEHTGDIRFDPRAASIHRMLKAQQPPPPGPARRLFRRLFG